MGPLFEVREVTAGMREVFERVLFDSLGTEQTAGACLHAAIILANSLSQFAKAPSFVCGGGPPMDGGLLDKAGKLRGHYWVEGTSASGQRFVADITADQFGYAKAVVLSGDEADLLYFKGDALLIAEHVLEEQSSWA